MLRSQSDALFILPLSWAVTVPLPVLVITAAYHPMFPTLEPAGTVTYVYFVQMFISFKQIILLIIWGFFHWSILIKFGWSAADCVVMLAQLKR